MKKILVLGGTGWLGREICVQGLAAGHQVQALARGTADFAPGTGITRADRTTPGAYAGLRDTAWDLVLELTSDPAQARTALEALAGHAKNWVNVSSCSVYASQAEADAGEESETVAPAEPEANPGGADYARAKSFGETETMRVRAGNALVLRPGLIGGPGDPSGRSSYWPLRFAEGRTPVLVPHDASGEARVQIIDVRDLAAFALEAGLASRHGHVNVVGQTCPLEDVLECARRAADTVATKAGAHVPDAQWPDAETVRYPVERLATDGINPWAGPTSLPLVLPSGDAYAGFARRSDARALALGLRRRDLLATFEDIVRNGSGTGVEGLRSGLGAAEESAIISWMRKAGT